MDDPSNDGTSGDGLSGRQRDALSAYRRLLDSYPEMFTGRERRPIVRDPSALRSFAQEKKVTLGVLAETPYLWLINDLVENRRAAGDTVTHPYLRVIAPPSKGADPLATGGTVALATVGQGERIDQSRQIDLGGQVSQGERIVLVEQERHSTGSLELELPRGFAEPGVSAADQALAELRQETGYLGEEARFLGTTVSDSGISDRSMSFFHVPVTGKGPTAREPSEMVTRVVLLTRGEVWERIESGAIRDAFTLQALALYERLESLSKKGV